MFENRAISMVDNKYERNYYLAFKKIHCHKSVFPLKGHRQRLIFSAERKEHYK